MRTAQGLAQRAARRGRAVRAQDRRSRSGGAVVKRPSKRPIEIGACLRFSAVEPEAVREARGAIIAILEQRVPEAVHVKALDVLRELCSSNGATVNVSHCTIGVKS